MALRVLPEEQTGEPLRAIDSNAAFNLTGELCFPATKWEKHGCLRLRLLLATISDMFSLISIKPFIFFTGIGLGTNSG